MQVVWIKYDGTYLLVSGVVTVSCTLRDLAFLRAHCVTLRPAPAFLRALRGSLVKQHKASSLVSLCMSSPLTSACVFVFYRCTPLSPHSY